MRHGRGFAGQPVQFALQALHGNSSVHGSRSTRVAQFPPPRQQRGCFECRDTSHMVRGCPKLQTDVSERGIQASRGRLRGEGSTR